AKLGGTLTGNTCINMDTTTMGSTPLLFELGCVGIPAGAKLYVGTSCNPPQHSSNVVYLCTKRCVGTTLICATDSGITQSYCKVTVPSSLHTTLLGTNAMVYGGDYENDFVARSLVTKQYVDLEISGATSGITGAITSASNGLTKNG